MTTAKTYTAEHLVELATGIFYSFGLNSAHTDTVSRGLVRANLRGLDSHGVSRIPMYITRLEQGLVNPAPTIKIENKTAAVSLVHADNAMGFIPAHLAMEEAMRLAENVGIGVVAVRLSTHFGMAALYALQAIERNFVSMIYTNSSPAMPMHGGRTAFLDASPIAAGIPGGSHGAPFVMDMAMTVVARGKIRLAAMRGEAIPEGLALDREGNPTTDAAKAFEGVCLPFGGVKGSVLGTMMDLLAGGLTGANFGGEVKSLYFDKTEPQNVGHLFFALRPDLFMALDDFQGRMDEFNHRIKRLPRTPGCDEILMPGEPESRTEQARLINGIPLTENVIADLTDVAARYQVAFPSAISSID